MFRGFCSLGVVQVLVVSLGVSSLASAQGAMPQHVFKRGELEILVVDDVYHGRSEQIYRLVEEQTGKKYDLKFETPPGLSKELAPPASPGAEWRTGDFVQVEGVLASPNALHVVASGDDGGEVKMLTKASSSTGTRKVAVLLINFKDATVSCSKNQVANIVFDNPSAGSGQHSVAEYFTATSFNQVSMPRDTDNDNQADVFGPFTINYRVSGSCDYDGWASAARSAATSNGVNLSLYQHVVLVLPSNVPCGWVGLGHLGCAGTCNTWITWCDTPDLYAHELGHNLGMHHASTDPNNDGVLDNEYGDKSDPMGWAGIGFRHNNAPHKMQMGWFDSYSGKVQTITQAGRYYIAPLELHPGSATLPQVLIIDKPNTNDKYYLSFRTNGEAYNDSMPSDYQNGVQIHKYAGSGMVNTLFVDSLKDGEVFTDSPNDLSVVQFAHDPHRIDGFVAVDITFGCTPLKPSSTLDPDGDYSVAPGTTVNYTLSVTNREGGNCGSATFDLSPVVPSGWSATLSTSQLTVGAGSTKSATLRVTAPSDATAGTYTVRVKVDDASGLRSTTYGTSTYEALNVTNEPPDAVNSLTGTATAEGYVRLDWNRAPDDSGYAAFYRVYHDSGDGFSFTGKTTNTTFTDRDAVTGTNRYYVVSVDSETLASPASNVVTVTLGTGSGGQPDPVTGLTASVSDGNIYLNWSASNGAAFYRIYHAANGNVSFLGKTTTTSFTHSEPIVGSNLYNIVAVSSTGERSAKGDVIEVVFSTAASESPDPVVTLTATVTSNGSVYLDWRRSRDDSGYAVKYRIRRDSGSGFRYIGEATVSAFTDENPANGLNRYMIVAIDEDGNKSSNGNIAEVNISASSDDTPEAVEYFSGRVNDDGSVNLRWKRSRAGSDYADFYRIYRSTDYDGGSTADFRRIGKSTLNEFTDSNARPGKNSYYVIAVMNDGTSSDIGKIVTVTS